MTAESWKNQKYRNQLFTRKKNGPPFFKSNSFSGHEPNHMYLNFEDGFQNVTTVSGADHIGDGRGFAILHYDNDGWQDIALVSTNAPRFLLFRNQLGDVYNNNRIGIKLIGANSSPDSSTINSNRDAIGAKVFATFESVRRFLCQKQIGEGNVAQNSSTIWIGQLPDNPIVKIEVRWPSGAISVMENPTAEYLIKISEPDSSGSMKESASAD